MQRLCKIKQKIPLRKPFLQSCLTKFCRSHLLCPQWLLKAIIHKSNHNFVLSYSLIQQLHSCEWNWIFKISKWLLFTIGDYLFLAHVVLPCHFLVEQCFLLPLGSKIAPTKALHNKHSSLHIEKRKYTFKYS